MTVALMEAALAYAACGIPVFPCDPINKEPLAPRDKDANGNPIPRTGGHLKATTDTKVIRECWTKRPDAAIGAPTGKRSGFDVLDRDCKKGKDGFAALNAAGIDCSSLSNVRARTHGVGAHDFFRSNGSAPAPGLLGVDIQSDGDYVILPPSPGYVWEVGSLLDVGVAGLPEWPETLKKFKSELNGASKENIGEKKSGPPEADIESVAAALEVIPNEDTFPRKEVSWDDWSRVGMLVWRSTNGADEGFDAWEKWSAKSEKHKPAKCEERWEHWTYSSPPTTGGAGSLFRLADEAARGPHWRPGRSVAPGEEFGGIIPARSKLYAVSAADACRMSLEERPEQVIEEVLDKGALSVMYGDSNTGKSFLGYDIGLHVGNGLPWCGRKTSKGLVAYVAAEGGFGARKRIKAWHDAKGLDPVSSLFALIPCPVDLRSAGQSGDATALIELIREQEALYGAQTALLIIDTLSRALSGGDENSSVDMGGFVKNIDCIRAALACHTNIIHHTGKDAARGMRGWSGIRAAVDTEIEIAKNVFSVTKQRDIEPAKEQRFALRKVTIGHEASGKPITSCVVEWKTAGDFDVLELTPAAAEMWEAFKIAARDRGRTSITCSEWEEEYFETRGRSAEDAISARQLRRIRKEVIESGYVEKDGSNFKGIQAQMLVGVK